jgi:hypothetical protein
MTFGTYGEPNMYELSVDGFNFTKWTHVVWTININGTWAIYNNGSLLKSQIAVYPTVQARTSNFIGQSNWAGDSSINYIGLMDEFRMYYKELSNVEVSTLYSLKNLDTLNKDNTLVIYYDFETLNGNTLINKGQNELVFDIFNQNKGSISKIKSNLPSTVNTVLKTNDYNYDSMFIINNQISLVNNSVYLDSTKEISASLSPFQTNGDGITIAFWFKSDNSNDNSKIFDFGNGPIDDNISFGIQNNLIYCSVVVNGQLSNYSSFYTVNVNDNTWRHVVWILQSNTWSFYINGILINTRNNAIYPKSVLRKNIYFGKSNTSTDPYFNGTLGDFRLYNRILSNVEINSLSSLQIVDSLNTDAKLSLSLGILTKFNSLNNSSALTLNSYQSQYIAIDPIQITNNGISIAFWVIQKNSSDSSKIFDFDSNIVCELNNNSLYFYINQDNAVNTFDPQITLPSDNIWSHITWTMNNSGIHKFYLNGIFVKIITSVYPTSNILNSNFIGKSSMSDSNNFSGILQEFYFINSEITDVIVSSLYSNPTNSYSDNSVLLYYNFDLTKIIKNNDVQPVPSISYNPSYIDPTLQIKSNTSNKLLDINSLTFQNNDYINVKVGKSDLNGNNGYTFAFWFKSNKSANWARIFDFGNGQGIDNIVFGIFHNSLACSIYNNTTSGDYIDFYRINDRVVNVNDNVWRHVTWVIQIPTVTKTVSVDPNNMQNIVAWYDPNNVSSQSGVVKKWNNVINNRLSLIPNNSTIIVNKLGNNQIVQFTNTASHLRCDDKDDINAFICLVKYDNGNQWNYLFAPEPNGDQDYSFRRGGFNSGIDGNDIENNKNGLIYIDGIKKFDSGKVIDSWNTVNSYRIIYVKFGDGNHSYKSGDTKLNVKISSTFGSRGFKGYIGDFFCLNSNHTNDDRLKLEGFIAKKWNLTSNLPSDHKYKNITDTPIEKLTSTWDIYVNSQLITTLKNAPYPNSVDRPYSYLGRSNWNNDPYLNGAIDDFRMYNRILSTNEINSLYNLTYTDPLSSNDKLIVSFPMYNPNNIIPYNFLKFNPTIQNYLNISSFTLLQNSLSFSFWFKTNSNNTPLFEISDDDQTINVRIDGQRLMAQQYSINNQSNTYISVSSNNVNDNNWKHFVWIIDPNNNWIFYLNGNKIQTTTKYQNIPLTFMKNYIGLISNLINTSTNDYYYYSGCISEFRILNRILTDSEVLSLYMNNYLSSLNDGKQIVYLPFDKNNVIIKSTSNLQLDGTLLNERAIIREKSVLGNSCVYLNKPIPISDKQYVTIEKFTINSDSFTIAFWYKFEPVNDQNTSIVDFASELNYFKIYITNNYTFNIDVQLLGIVYNNSYDLTSYKSDWFHFVLIVKK